MNKIQLQFDLLKSVLCLNGEIPDKDLFAKYNKLPLIAADGASNMLLAMGIKPTTIVGDLDSIDKSTLPAAIELIHIPEQDSTDFEKCLEIIRQRNLLPCLVYGATGKETDHTLYNMHVMAKYEPKHQIIFHDSAYKNKQKYGTFINGDWSAELAIGSKVSLIAFEPVVVSTNGLNWELNKATLSTLVSSVRNHVKHSPIEINVHSGNLLLLFDSGDA